ncbi:MAG: hypothetical protein R3F16_05095 [Myxococcota bacterium]|nr:hypothetical protein [Myxococcales bacterium]
MRRDRWHVRRWGAVLAVCPVVLMGCGLWLHSDYPEERRALLECERENGVGSARCDALRARVEIEGDAYESEARRAWGCSGSQPDARCPIER